MAARGVVGCLFTEPLRENIASSLMMRNLPRSACVCTIFWQQRTRNALCAAVNFWTICSLYGWKCKSRCKILRTLVRQIQELGMPPHWSTWTPLQGYSHTLDIFRWPDSVSTGTGFNLYGSSLTPLTDYTGQQNLTFFLAHEGKYLIFNRTFNAEFKYVSSFSPSPTGFVLWQPS